MFGMSWLPRVFVLRKISKLKILKPFLKKARLWSCLLFFLPGWTWAQDADFERLAEDRLWLGQLQYRRTLTGTWQSEADGTEFFISKKGKTSPLDELRATYELMTQRPETPWGYISQPVVCAFPTRKKFLQEKMKIRIKEIPCPERDEWQKAFHGSRVHLVFSDAFPNNPASMFGHTFLLFSKHEPVDSGLGLLDYSVNFSADTSSANTKSLFYTLRGLMGGYEGRYRLQPFYLMTNAYVNWESRDLWSLKLPLNDTQVERLTDHIWEIFTTTYFDYFFFDENCTYRLLAALDYADPELQLLDEYHQTLPLYYVAPISGYRALRERYQVQQEHYSPSIQKRLKTEIHALSAEDLARFRLLVNDSSLLADEKNVPALDAFISYNNYRKHTFTNLPEEVLSTLESGLRRRASIAEPSAPSPPVPKPSSPANAHPIPALWAGAFASEKKQGFELGFKAGYHDLLSPSEGLVRWSHLNFAKASWEFSEREVTLRSFLAADIISFFPWNEFERKPSWRVSAGYDQENLLFAKGGVGLTFASSEQEAIFYGFLSPTLSGNRRKTHDREGLLEAEVGMAAELTAHLKIWLSYRDFLRDPTWNLEENLEQWSLQTSCWKKNDSEFRLVVDKLPEEWKSRLLWQLNL